jgi:hypothetical protein
VLPYTIEEHKHRFCAWAAGRAASVKGCRFTVRQAKAIIENAHLNRLLIDPNNLPLPQDTDKIHREWRQNVITAANGLEIDFTHGVAAKLINCYLKAGFVCGGYHTHDRVQALHPPIDSVLLAELSAKNIGENKLVWDEARNIRWSHFTSEQYEKVINHIRTSLSNQALWEVEKHWRGYQ